MTPRGRANNHDRQPTCYKPKKSKTMSTFIPIKVISAREDPSNAVIKQEKDKNMKRSLTGSRHKTTQRTNNTRTTALKWSGPSCSKHC